MTTYNLDKLLAAGVGVNYLVSQLEPWQIARSLDELLAAGAKIDINDLVSQLDPQDITDNLDELLAAGADANYLVSRLYPWYTWEVVVNLDKLLAAGADKDYLESRINEWRNPTRSDS